MTDMERGGNGIYTLYGLSDNPFPQSPTVIIDSPDKRLNGRIFYEGIFPDKVAKFKELLEKRTNMIYVRGSQYVKGDGKSALMAHAFFMYERRQDTAVAFIRCTGRNGKVSTPEHYCREIIRQLHQRGYLWKAFGALTNMFLAESSKYVYARPGAALMFKKHNVPPDTLPFTRFTNISRVGEFAKVLSEWIVAKTGCSAKFTHELVKAYLERPATMEKEVIVKNSDKIEDFGDCLKILRAGGFGWCYFFLDQMEESLDIPAGAIGNFTSALRRVIEKSSGFATLVATLHASSVRTLLDNPEGRVNIQSFAPLDENHYVTLYPDDIVKDNRVVGLVETYLREFTIDATKPSPFDPQVIKYVAHLYRGNLREILRTMHHMIMSAASKRQQLIDMAYVKANHNEAVGKEFSEETYQQFMTSMQLGRRPSS
ncbi:hypothetical protein [Nitrososphaera viennensis]|nr:hypothetical protein [Nitrososphaera viennensis]UVS70060.1 hypothetical protein NWT39_04550 [Nitrososphaera viennensis]